MRATQLPADRPQTADELGSLLPHRADAEARTALATAATDPDADFRAYASRADS